MTQLDSTVVNVSLEAIRADLQSTLSTAQWIVSAYLLALALMLPLNGWLVDRIGAKKLYLGCFSGFTAASVLCGAAHSMQALILARVLQGVAGGLLAPMTQLMIARVAGRHLPRVMGYTAMPILLATTMGPVVAGSILKYSAWPWLFYLNLPIGILAVGLAAYLLPSDAAIIRRRPFDFMGFAILSPGLACFLYGLDHVQDAAGYMIFGAIAIAGFVLYALRKNEDALIDLHLFGNDTFSAAATTQFLGNGLAYAGQFLIPLYLITSCGLTAAHAGWLLASMGLGMLVTFPLMGYLTDRFGFRAVSSGGVFLALMATLPFLWMLYAGFSPTITVITLFFRGMGQSAVGIPSVSAAYASIPHERLPMATTAINIVQRLGGPVATTITAIALARGGSASFTLAFLLIVGIYLAALVSARQLPARAHAPV